MSRFQRTRLTIKDLTDVTNPEMQIKDIQNAISILTANYVDIRQQLIEKEQKTSALEDIVKAMHGKIEELKDKVVESEIQIELLSKVEDLEVSNNVSNNSKKRKIQVVDPTPIKKIRLIEGYELHCPHCQKGYIYPPHRIMTFPGGEEGMDTVRCEKCKGVIAVGNAKLESFVV